MDGVVDDGVGRRHMQPVELAADPHSAFVEIRHLGCPDRLPTGGMVVGQALPRVENPVLDRPIGRPNSVLIGHQLAGAVQGDKMPFHQPHRIGLPLWAKADFR